MLKGQFVNELYIRLSDLPSYEVKRYVEYYLEMIDDRMDEGMSEEEAVEAVDSLDEIESRIRSEKFDTIIRAGGQEPPNKEPSQEHPDGAPPAAQEGTKEHFWDHMEGWQIALLIVFGLPALCVAAALTISAVSVAVSLLISAFAVVIALFAVSVALGIVGAALIAAGIVGLTQGQVPFGLFVMGAGFLLIGLSILSFWGLKGLMKSLVKLVKYLFRSIRAGFSKGRVQQ